MADVSKKGQEIKIQGNNLFERFQGKTIDLKCFKIFWNVLEVLDNSRKFLGLPNNFLECFEMI